MSLLIPETKITSYGAHYSMAVPSGALTLVAADGPLWACRWTSATHVAAGYRVSYSVVTTDSFALSSNSLYFTISR